MKTYIVSFTHEQCVVSYGDTEVTVHGQWASAGDALDAVVAKFDGYNGVIATEQSIHVFDSDTGTSHYYEFSLDTYSWTRTD